MSWLYLLLAGGFEVAWAQSLKPTDGFTRPLPTLICAVLGVTGVWLLTLALRELPTGTGYAVFTGIGCIGAVSLGILVHGDAVTAWRLLAVTLILAGVVAARVSA
ncbi:multidrug efflux SMR transporter [Conexibacter sp. JD483]|uniref:DMT family transporter n=1 Tax=unclassified Conexibacter TaxID=2627773 RepID=UPI0027292312|nr:MULTISPECIES: multidrug efflux SMR transporter [unclassified Conexibacter]MDO8188806.1 multidrug efflux SMR transporter [Conexibacter sp. CPCC 205706]MDO8201651.1 multidrug efflux SMR transporter [Conexibacter sp. CPCC 205762]MDR9371335.1 multidrug efflux SMR transporter [Conexibacter sp. JD483]